MGAYLSQPVTKKVSSDGGNEYVTYGDSSMQGWRVSQEDAHNSIPDFLSGCSLFAVYDGHGGHEVAAYTAQVLPGFIRDHPLYKDGHVRNGLRQAFLEFDQTLTQHQVIDQLKVIAGRENESEEDEDDETDKEVDELFQEAHMPLDQLVAKYTAGGGGGGGEKPEKPAAGGVSRLKSKEKKKVLSPFLRAKTGGAGHISGSECSSSTAPEDGGGSSSSSSSSTDSVVQKNLSMELREATADSSNTTAENEDSSANTNTAVESDSVDKSESTDGALDKEVTLTKTEGVGKPSDALEGQVESKKDAQSAEKSSENGSEGSGDADSTEQSELETAKSECKPSLIKDSVPQDGAGDAKPVLNGTKNAENGNGDVTPTPANTPKKGGKGAKPGSGKSPASAEALKAAAAAANPQKPTRKMPERVAAEIYRDVLAGARLAKETGMGDDEATEEEEEADEDFSMDQSDSVEDEEDDDEDDEGEEEEEEDEGEEDEDSDEVQDEGEELEDDDFMMNMKDEPGSDSGCTAVVALLHGRHLYVANIGDSRCVLSRSGRAVDMSADHKPEDEPELQRILKAGGKVTMDGRVNGGLNLSRAFGDHAYKTNASLPADQQMISASPDVRCVLVEPGDEFMVLACDGIWNSKRSQEVVDFVSERIRERGETQMSKICEELFMECLASNTMGDGTGCDNMTCIIVKFNPSLATVQAPPIAPEVEESVSEVSDSNGVKGEEEENGDDTSAKKDEKGAAADAAEDASEAKCKEEAIEDKVKKAEVKTVAECDTSATAVVRPAEELADQPPGKRQRVD